jgi:uncharacterized protein YtpQ (UPF0354 family)
MKTIEVSDQLAELLSEKSKEEREFLFDKLEKQLRISKMNVLRDEIHAEAVSKGLTPELAEEIERELNAKI